VTRFEFATATRIMFGAGMAGEAISAAKQMGQRALLVTGSCRERSGRFSDVLRATGIAVTAFSVGQEPDLALVQQGLELARQEKCDFVIAVGGGSVMDAGKAISALLTHEGSLMDYLEVIGRGRPLERPAAACIAIPTTAGTGSEVTRNAVLASPKHGVKASMRSPLMLPRLAVVDPELTYDLPPAITASTGMDALTQVIEPYVSVRANPMTDGFCLEGMGRAARSLLRAFQDGRSTAARTDMALASLLGGLALANAGLGVVHGCAAPIGGMFRAPHGAACAALLGPGMAVNIHALRLRSPGSESLARYQKIAAVLTQNPGAAPEDGPAFVRDLCAELAIPPLSSYGIREADVGALVTQALRASSMKGNPVALESQELAAMLSDAM